LFTPCICWFSVGDSCAELLAQRKQFAGAIGVLRAAMHLAKTAAEVAAVETRTSWVESNQAGPAILDLHV